MIFLTGYFEVCLSEIKERSLNSWFLTVFFFLYPCGTNKICKTCSVTQIRGGRMRIGRDGSWQQATTGFEQKSDCCSGTKWLIRQKEIGSEKARNAILLWQQLLDCQFTEEHKPTKSNLDFGIIPKERNLVEFHVILSGFHWPKIMCLPFFQLHFGRTSGSQFARGHELTYSHRTSGQAPAAAPCPCPSALRGPERDESD